MIGKIGPVGVISLAVLLGWAAYEHSQGKTDRRNTLLFFAAAALTVEMVRS